MAQSALTVTPPNPTPPTNMSLPGRRRRTRPTHQAHLCGLHARIPTSIPIRRLTSMTAPPARCRRSPPTRRRSRAAPAPRQAVPRAHIPARASGAVPASTSVAHEGAGTEVSVLAPGNIVHTYPGAVTMNTSQSVSDLGSYTTAPNQQHASSLSPAANPTFTSFTAGASVSGVGTTTLSCVTVAPPSKRWSTSTARRRRRCSFRRHR